MEGATVPGNSIASWCWCCVIVVVVVVKAEQTRTKLVLLLLLGSQQQLQIPTMTMTKNRNRLSEERNIPTDVSWWRRFSFPGDTIVIILIVVVFLLIILIVGAVLRRFQFLGASISSKTVNGNWHAWFHSFCPVDENCASMSS